LTTVSLPLINGSNPPLRSEARGIHSLGGAGALGVMAATAAAVAVLAR
jgi:hypothetical protein